VVSWVRPYGKGRVFYCTLGHAKTAYTNPAVMKHYLAGIQFAIGDLKADASPRP
jgi:type 1 glutamine amidotransferase